MFCDLCGREIFCDEELGRIDKRRVIRIDKRRVILAGKRHETTIILCKDCKEEECKK